MSTTPLVDSVRPNEVGDLPGLSDEPAVNDALSALAVACNGFVYAGSDLVSQVRALRFLRTRPDIVTALGLGSPAPNQVGDDRVLWGVVANAGRLSARSKPRWAHVSDATGLGSNSSAELCRRFDFDPDQSVGG